MQFLAINQNGPIDADGNKLNPVYVVLNRLDEATIAELT